LVHADAIVMSDGEEVSGWDDIDVNIAAAAGIGGPDTGAEAASTWWKIFAMWNGSTKGLMMQRAKDYKLDTSYIVSDDANQGLRSAVDNSTVKVAQGFQVATAGLIEFVDVSIGRTATPTGNFWYTIEANNGGVPSNTPLATSEKLDAARVMSVAGGKFVRIVFRTPFSAAAATQYHLVMQGDYTVSAANFIYWRKDTAGAGYASGSMALFDSDTSTWTVDAGADLMFKIYVTENDTALVVPSGYRYAHIGWAYNNASSNLKHFFQRDRSIFCGNDADWWIGNFGVTSNLLVDLAAFVPPVPIGLEATVQQVTANSHVAIGQLSTTDVASGSNNERVGQVDTQFVAASNGPMSRIELSQYQGFMIDSTAATNKLYVTVITF
jgi:hypothetical protein